MIQAGSANKSVQNFEAAAPYQMYEFEEESGLDIFSIFTEADAKIKEDWKAIEYSKITKASSIKKAFYYDEKKNALVPMEQEEMATTQKEVYELTLYLMSGEFEKGYGDPDFGKIFISSYDWNQELPLSLSMKNYLAIIYSGDVAMKTNSHVTIAHMNNKDMEIALDTASPGGGLGWQYPDEEGLVQSATFSYKVIQGRRPDDNLYVKSNYYFATSDRLHQDEPVFQSSIRKTYVELSPYDDAVNVNKIEVWHSF